MKSRIALALLLSLAAASVAAQTTSQTRILIPAYQMEPAHGAYGSIWASELVVRNDGSRNVEIVLGCMINECPPFWTMAPGDLLTNPVLPTSSQPGAGPHPFLVVAPADAKLNVTHHIRDLSRQALTWGTEVPTVPESEFTYEKSSLLPVPTDARFRVTLRVYTRAEGAAAAFHVRAYAIQSSLRPPLDFLAATTVVGLPATAHAPGYAVINDLVSAMPAVRTAERIRLEIEPIVAGTEFWTFASVTNNETQHVTLVTP